MSHVFISYSKQNQAYARRLADALIAAGFDVWIDDQIDYGEDWWRTIVRAIRGAKAFVAVMSEDSDASDWVQREVTLADKHKIPAFPLWLSGDMDASENWAIYVRTQYADVRGGKLPGDDFYRRLERAAPRRTAGRNITPPPNPLPVHGEGESDIPASDDSAPEKGPPVRQQKNLMPPDVSGILPPPFEWCEIPAGQVTIRYTARAKATTDVPYFIMAKYPITNAQYQIFVDSDDGYADPAWWGFSDPAKLWRRENKQPRERPFIGDDLPRTEVSWYEAVAFCRWLTLQLYPEGVGNWIISLPSEQQWQRAAQGDDGREYPWGNEFNKLYCNTEESQIGMPTHVNYYSNGMSPFGLIDMAGNIWEWCLTKWETGNADLGLDDPRVRRGGAFDTSNLSASCYARDRNFVWNWTQDNGFRVCATMIRDER